jgi:hypothetical protein
MQSSRVIGSTRMETVCLWNSALLFCTLQLSSAETSVVGEVASVVLKMRSFERERYRISNSSQAMLELAQTNNQENFGDIIKAHHVIPFRELC